MTEEWRDVIGFEGVYQVSSLGRVKSMARVIRYVDGRVRTYPEALLSPCDNGDGYRYINPRINGKQKIMLVHNMMLEAFCGPRPGSSSNWHGCHNDGDTSNNKLDNLRWATRSANERDKEAHGTSNRGGRNGQAKLTESDVVEIRRRLASGEKARLLAEAYKVSATTVYSIGSNATWKSQDITP